MRKMMIGFAAFSLVALMSCHAAHAVESGSSKFIAYDSKEFDAVVDKLPFIEHFDAGRVSASAFGEYTLFFETPGEMRANYTSSLNIRLNKFKIKLDNDFIKFKEKYQFLYSGYDDLIFRLKKTNARNYILEITDPYGYTEKEMVIGDETHLIVSFGTIEKIYFVKGSNGYEISKMERIYTEEADEVYKTCSYDLQRITGSLVNLQEAFVHLDDDKNCV